MIELRSSTGRLDKMYTRQSLFIKLSIRDSALLFCLPVCDVLFAVRRHPA